MNKKIGKEILLILIVSIISLTSSYFIFDDIVMYLSNNSLIFISFRIFLIIALYVIVKWIMNMSINKKVFDVLFVSYLLIIIMSSLLGDRTNHMSYINYNILAILSDNKLLVVLNIIGYLPFGVYTFWRFKCNMLIRFIPFILFVFIIEFSQFCFRKGIMDINDIITNTFGFLLGFYILPIYSIVRIKYKTKSYKV